jgi:hypothetical protein
VAHLVHEGLTQAHLVVHHLADMRRGRVNGKSEHSLYTDTTAMSKQE